MTFVTVQFVNRVNWVVLTAVPFCRAAVDDNTSTIDSIAIAMEINFIPQFFPKSWSYLELTVFKKQN